MTKNKSKICLTPNCGKPLHCKNLCEKCYSKKYRKENKKRISAHEKELIKQRKASGVCIYCTKKPLLNRHYCRVCKNRFYDYHLQRLCGITLEHRNKIYKKQKGLCAACKKPIPKRAKETHVDHDHITGEFRGLLCSWCNVAIGYIEHETYSKILRYLKKFKENAAA